MGSFSPEQVLKSILSANSMASSPEYRSLGTSRALAQYRTSMPGSERKDDYHWLLLAVESDVMRVALFTLSVLADKANSQSTAALAESLRERIAAAEFS